MSKFIFLNFDGVLNDPYWLVKHHRIRFQRFEGMEFDLRRVEYLARIVDFTGAKLVLSSSWNKREGVKKFFESLGFEVAGQLGDYYNRGNAIKRWTTEHALNDTDYIIIDDEKSDYDERQLDRLVYTGTNNTISWVLYNPNLIQKLVGLTEEHIYWAIKLLGGDIEGYAKDDFIKETHNE